MKFEKNMQVGLESEGGKLYPPPAYSISLHEMPIKPGKETNWLDLEEEGNIDCNLCVRERVGVDSLFSSRERGCNNRFRMDFW